VFSWTAGTPQEKTAVAAENSYMTKPAHAELCGLSGEILPELN
jgi:hypothetical protein